jgi:hypothetical protein
MVPFSLVHLPPLKVAAMATIGACTALAWACGCGASTSVGTRAFEGQTLKQSLRGRYVAKAVRPSRGASPQGEWYTWRQGRRRNPGLR